MARDAPPVTAVALFMDEARAESSGKNIFIGEYTGDMLLSPTVYPPDRLTVLFFLRWPNDFSPRSLAVRIELPGQPPIVQSFPPPTKPGSQRRPIPPFDRVSVQVLVQLRFPPLRVGDHIDAWAIVDGHDLPAGTLWVSEFPSAMHVGEETEPDAEVPLI